MRTVSINKNNPPVAKKEKHEISIHNQVLSDDYFWLRERENPKVIDYLKAENEYADKETVHLKELEQQLFDEMLGRIEENDLSVPVKEGEYYYYTRTEENKSYAIHCRKRGTLEAVEEVLLDENIFADGLEYFALGDFEITDNHKILGYSIDVDGSEQYDIFIKKLDTGELFPDVILKTGGDIVWANDNETFFYTRLDETMRSYQLYRHKLGTSTDEDVLVFEEKDESFYVSAAKSKSDQWLIMDISNKVTSEIWLLDANDPEGTFKLFSKRKPNVEYGLVHHDQHFYILTNEDALNSKLLKTPINQWDKKHWETVIPYDPNIKLEDLEVFKDHLFINCRKNGVKTISILRFSDQHFHDIEFDEAVYTIWDNHNPGFNTNKLRFNYSSFISPQQVIEYDMDSKKRKVLRSYKVLGDYNPTLYKVERIFAKASDGTKIPMSLVYRKDLKKDGQNPCLLNAYGSYSISTEPHFRSTWFSMLDRGFVMAIAHIRGGGEMGRQWYEDGKFLKKQNTFNDFIACSEHLIKAQYTNKEKLAIMGGSAGGLLMGAVINKRPDLYKVVLAMVPFVDVINTMLDETIPLTILEYDEWGNPNEKEYFDYMLSYSPYDNVEAKDYPTMLITAGLNDPRVQYWEPAKWTAKLRAMKTDNNQLLLKTNMGAGHGGKSGRYGYLEELASYYAFILDCLGVSGI